MYKYIYLIAFSTCLLTTKAAAVDLNDLIKVTPESKVRCVEYYTYQNETYCSTKALGNQTVDPQIKDYEHMDIQFDDRTWKLAWGKTDNFGDTVEYVVDGDDINNWHELITSQFYPNVQDKLTLKEFADGAMADLKKDGFKPIITFHEVSDDRVIFEFRLEEPENQIQDEIQMLTKDDQGVYILHYVIKKSDMGDENRQKWIENFKNSTIKE